MKLLQELIEIIISYLDFNNKINLYKTSKKYKFVLDFIFQIPRHFETKANNNNIQYFKNLKNLNLYNNESITDSGITGLINITNLNLRSNKLITNDGITGLTNITNLNLGGNKLITNKGIIHLTNIVN